MTDPLLGTELGRYRVERLLGEGGMGAVYLGVQPMIGSRVAIKVLSHECARSEELLERFFAEARSVNLVRHENIVSVLDLAQLPDGRPYIVMEFIEGLTLGQLIRGSNATGERLPIGGVVQVASEMLSALGAAHTLGIVHRDLKPDNVLVTAEGHAKVLDFGIAKLAPGLNQHSPRTRTGALLGTPSYMAPEQISGSGMIDARTDLYAAGVVLFEALTGTQPFTGDTLFDLMRGHLETAPPSPRARRPELPLSIEHVILTALEKDPARRFQTAAAMMQALRTAAQEIAPDQWRSLSSRTHARISMEHVRQPTPLHDDIARGPTRLATPLPLPADAAAKTERTPGSNKGIYTAIAAITVVGAIVGVVALTGGKKDVEKVASTTTEAGSAVAIAPVVVDAGVAPVVPATNPPPPTRAPTPQPAPAKTIAKPVIVNGGSAADHGVHVGAGVEAGPGVIIGSNPPAPGTPKRTTRPIDFDPKKFDAMAYLPRAFALAKAVFPDAGFTRMDVPNVFPTGIADLTIGDDVEAEFYFRSPSRSVRPAGIPKNQEVEITCYVQVTVSAKEVEVRPRELSPIDSGCKWPIRPLPTCRLAAVWTHAKGKGAEADTIAKIAFLSDGKWFFDNDADGYDGITETIADRCP